MDRAVEEVIPMGISEIISIVFGGGIALTALVDISPIKLNPWKRIFRALGKALNGEVLDKLAETQKKLEAHITADDERNADMRRTRILRFNNELIRELPHTREDFIDVLADIDDYEAYCREHPTYKNNRAIHAIANIGRVYDERMKKHDFLI